MSSLLINESFKLISKIDAAPLGKWPCFFHTVLPTPPPILSCGTILNLPVSNFNGIYEGPIFRERTLGTNECPEYCLYQDQLDNGGLDNILAEAGLRREGRLKAQRETLEIVKVV